MATFDYICHGSGVAMHYVFNGVATMFYGGGIASRVFGTMVFNALSVGIAVIGVQLATRLNLIVTARQIASLFFIYTLLNVPIANLNVIDKVTGRVESVAHVPYALAAFAGTSSQLGNFLARQFDFSFSPIPPGGSANNFNGNVRHYTDSGMAMASRLVAEASKFTIPNAVQAANMKEFVKTCIIMNGLVKGKYTEHELLSSDNVWQLVKDNASPRFGFRYKHIDGSPSEILTCREAAIELDREWLGIERDTLKFFGHSFYSSNTRAQQAIAYNLEASYKFLTNLSKDASTILRQNIMRNMIEEGAYHGMASYDVNMAMQAYAQTKAMRSQETSMMTLGRVGATFLTPLKIVMEALFYGLFPIIVIMMVISCSWALLKTYVLGIFWIQSWPPLLSILNMVVNVYGQQNSMAAVTDVGGAALNLYTIGDLGQANSLVAATASQFIAYVPMLSYLIYKSGAGVLSQLSTSLMGTLGGHVDAPSREVTGATMQMDTTAFDTHSAHMNSGFKHDTNMMVRDGAYSFQEGDGTMSTIQRDGSLSYDRGGALGNIGAGIRFDKSIASSFQKSADESHRAALSETESLAQSTSAGFKKLYDYKNTRGESFGIDDAAHHNESWLKDSAMNKSVDYIVKFADDNKISYTDSQKVLTSIAAHAGFNASAGVKILGNGVEASTGVAGRLQLDNANNIDVNQLYTKGQDFVEKHGFVETYRASVNESNSLTERATSTQGNDITNSLASDFSEAQSHASNISASLAQEKSYRDAANYYEHEGISLNTDMQQQFINHHLANKYSPDSIRKIIQTPDLLANEMNSYVESKKEELAENFYNSSSASADQIVDQHTTNQKKTNSNILEKHEANDIFIANKSQEFNVNEELQRKLKKEIASNIDAAQSKIASFEKNIASSGANLKDEIEDKVGE